MQEKETRKFRFFDQAMQFAIHESNHIPDFFHVILSQGFYYVEKGDVLIRVWETLIATYQNGRVIKK